MRVVALLGVRNEARYLRRCLEHLRCQGVEACVIDNDSTDDSREIAESFLGNGVFRIDTIPYQGFFDLRAQLRRKEQLATDIDADWFIHQDADEIMEPPAPWRTLHSAIAEIDAQGFSAINFDEFVFPPTSEQCLEGCDYVAHMRHYYFFQQRPQRLIRVWKKRPTPPELVPTGGHGVMFEGRRVYPQNFVLRHYIALSLAHLRAKYLGRVFPAEELMHGMHVNRVATTQDFVRLPPIDQLNEVDGVWRTDRPNASHLVFRQPKPYVCPKQMAEDPSRSPMPFVVGVARSGTTLLRLMLDAHPDLAMTPETGWLGAALKALQRGVPPDAFINAITSEPNWPDMEMSTSELGYVLAQADVSPGGMLRAIYWEYARRHGAKRVGDKTPLNGTRMIDIMEFLSEARFVHIIRDGRDVALSLRDLWFGPGRDPEIAALFWLWHIREMRQQAQFLPYYMEVRFEDLVTDPQRVLRQISEFIDLPFHPDQLRAHERASARLTELKDVQWPNRLITREQRLEIFSLTASPPDASRIGVWRNEMSEKDQAAFNKVAGAVLIDLGYAS